MVQGNKRDRCISIKHIKQKVTDQWKRRREKQKAEEKRKDSNFNHQPRTSSQSLLPTEGKDADEITVMTTKGIIGKEGLTN
jgi:hypothetical protein